MKTSKRAKMTYANAAIHVLKNIEEVTKVGIRQDSDDLIKGQFHPCIEIHKMFMFSKYVIYYKDYEYTVRSDPAALDDVYDDRNIAENIVISGMMKLHSKGQLIEMLDTVAAL